MNHSLGMVIETLVAILLLITIGYCMLLNNRLKRLRSDEHSLKAVIAELITATEIAERAIGGLKHAVRDVNENLGNQLASATQMSDHLKRQLSECDHVVRRLSKIAIAARPPQGAIIEPEPARLPSPKTVHATTVHATTVNATTVNANPSSAKAVAAAAQAFSERRRTGGLAA
jgi:low affinity Fe/Cu permease